MATKWESSYTELENINNGYEFQDGDAITTESVNTPIKNADYAVKLAQQAVDGQKYGIYQVYKATDLTKISASYTFEENGFYVIEVGYSADGFSSFSSYMIYVCVTNYYKDGNVILQDYHTSGVLDTATKTFTVSQTGTTARILSIYKIR